MLPSSCSSLIAEVPGYMSWCFSTHLLFVEMLAQVSFRCPFAILCMPVVRKRPASALASTSGTPGSEVVHGQESLPSLAELQAITDVGEFRQRAVGLGLVIRVRKSDGSGWKLRAKADIMDDYNSSSSRCKQQGGRQGDDADGCAARWTCFEERECRVPARQGDRSRSRAAKWP